jgi:hypothetical protein
MATVRRNSAAGSRAYPRAALQLAEDALVTCLNTVTDADTFYPQVYTKAELARMRRVFNKVLKAFDAIREAQKIVP